MYSETSVNLQSFYPGTIKIIDQNITESIVKLKLKSGTTESNCPVCSQKFTSYHSTYTRKVSDLPLLGRPVELQIIAYRYYCTNNTCAKKIFAEELEGFAGRYRRKTERLEKFIVTIATNTSCEGASRICKHMGVKVSGDSIIHLIRMHYEHQEISCGSIIGVDDWAYKKGHSYGTIICDADTHKPVALLDGRDGSELEKWLTKNPHVKVVTRDRANAYAKVISNVIPNAIQVADRFHPYRNLFKTVKEAISSVIPNRVPIPDQNVSEAETKLLEENDDKKKSIYRC